MDNKNFVANEEATFVAPSQNSPEMNSQPEMAVVPSSNHPGPPPDYFTDDLPPAYQVASALPTYEEAELTKGKIKKEFTTRCRSLAALAFVPVEEVIDDIMNIQEIIMEV